MERIKRQSENRDRQNNVDKMSQRWRELGDRLKTEKDRKKNADKMNQR